MSADGALRASERSPHDYTHVGSGRWVCATCRVFIVNQDCQVNREWAQTVTSASGDLGEQS